MAGMEEQKRAELTIYEKCILESILRAIAGGGLDPARGGPQVRVSRDMYRCVQLYGREDGVKGSKLVVDTELEGWACLVDTRETELN